MQAQRKFLCWIKAQTDIKLNGHVVENGHLEAKLLSTDDGIWESRRQEELLEDRQLQQQNIHQAYSYHFVGLQSYDLQKS